MNLADRILKNTKTKLFPIEMKEWGETVYMRRMSVDEAMKLRDLKVDDERTALVTMFNFLCDESGDRLFNDEQINQMMKQCGGDELKPLLDHFQTINGFSDVAKKKVKRRPR